MNDTDYKNYVSLAKRELKAIEGHEIRICEYAIKVCTIRHGGHSKGYYTIKDFAQDIGIPFKTLQRWTVTYRNVVQKLDKKITTSEEFSQARQVENILREERIVNNRMADKPKGSRYANSLPVEPEKINRIFNALEKHERPFEGEFANMLRSSKHNLELLKKRDLNIIADEHLLFLMGVLDQASDLINNHLTNKKKRYGKAA